MSEPARQDPELTTVDSAAASPAFESIKSAERAIAAVLKSHRSRVEGARSALAAAERAYESRVAKAKTAVDRAAQPNKIAAIGIVRRVTLTETTITTPKGQFELTPEVVASAEQHGNKQVVQGWVFKSDHDRREVYLHINGPTWGDVVPFSVRHSLSEPRDLHAFAAKVGATARNVEAAKAAIAERVRAAEREVIQALCDRAAVEQAAAALLAATWEVDEVKAVKDRVEAFVADAPMDDRRAKKARESVQALHEQGNRWAQEALNERARVRGASEIARREATSRERVATRLVQLAARETPETKPSAANKHEASVASSGDILDQIRKLGELHEAGVLTTEEFSSKKAELLMLALTNRDGHDAAAPARPRSCEGLRAVDRATDMPRAAAARDTRRMRKFRAAWVATRRPPGARRERVAAAVVLQEGGARRGTLTTDSPTPRTR